MWFFFFPPSLHKTTNMNSKTIDIKNALEQHQLNEQMHDKWQFFFKNNARGQKDII